MVRVEGWRRYLTPMFERATDSETGMDDFNTRYYGSAVGRFTSPDPMNLGADLLDPQSWNAYAYVRNNPLALVDPSGVMPHGRR